MKPTKKTKPAIWRAAFPEQAAKLRPESTERGGVKARSGSEQRRMDVYNAINALFAAANPHCEACHRIPLGGVQTHNRDETHHVKGRDGLLLFDVRYFMSVCRWAHRWIHAHPAEAKKLGWLGSKK